MEVFHNHCHLHHRTVPLKAQNKAQIAGAIFAQSIQKKVMEIEQPLAAAHTEKVYLAKRRRVIVVM
jgi:hypothetical protein